MENKILSVAIDGPAGVGKSTISKLVAQKLGWSCLDTGALYRAVTLACLENKIDCQNENSVAEFVNSINLSVDYANGVQITQLNGVNVNSKIRSEMIDKTVAYVAKIKRVREKVLALQRKIAFNSNVVIEGRDIGNNVIPESVNKFFLTATAEERANRRYQQRILAGEVCDYNEILSDVKLRDKIDQEREISPLKPAHDAEILDTTNLSIDDVVILIYEKIKKN